MARQVRITDIQPSSVSKIIETNYKIKRDRFGYLTDDRSDFMEYLKNPWVISILGILFWLFLHFTFVHSSFSYVSGPTKSSYFKQYMTFLLGNDLTFAFPFLSLSGLIKYFVNKKLNQIRIEREI
jgi:hypothetical protein